MPLLRRGTFDESIWNSPQAEYPMLPEVFSPGEIVLDVGCHTGAVCVLAADRGATVVGYEANWQNYGLAALNTRGQSEITVRHGAVWRSDAPSTEVIFTPSADSGNTGGGSVLFATPEAHRLARPSEGFGSAPAGVGLQSHPVPTVPLDDILRELGRVRFLKLDAEGAEFPILLTATELGRVQEIGGEYHELAEEGMALLSGAAQVGGERYTGELLAQRLVRAGFDTVELKSSVFGRGWFWGRRAAEPSGPGGELSG